MDAALHLVSHDTPVSHVQLGNAREGVFKVQKVKVFDFDRTRFLYLLASLERNSTHPIAKAIVQYRDYLFGLIQPFLKKTILDLI